MFLLSIVILNRIDYSNNNNNIIDSNNITINGDTQRKWSSPKQGLCIPSLTNKCFLLPLILFILTLGILTVILIGGIEHINNLKSNLQIKQNFIVETQNKNNQTVKISNKVLLEQYKRIEQFNKTLTELNNQNNQTVKQLNDQLLEKNATIEHLNKTVIECKAERSRINSQLK